MRECLRKWQEHKAVPHGPENSGSSAVAGASNCEERSAYGKCGQEAAQENQQAQVPKTSESGAAQEKVAWLRVVSSLAGTNGEAAAATRPAALPALL